MVRVSRREGGQAAHEVAEGLRLAEDHREQGQARRLKRVGELQELADVVDALPRAGFPIPDRAFRQAGPLAQLPARYPDRKSVV